jgi:nucleoside-diphosphate-sugar epimerase
MALAFVTGGSGFVGGALIERLRSEGEDVRALARSDTAAARVTELGASPVHGDLEDLPALRAGSDGADVVFHCAAKADDWGHPDHFEQINVQGTRNVLTAAREAGARRVVHVGTEAALMAGQPLVNVNEDTPLQPDSPVLYSRTKARAEQAVRDANGPDLETVVIRPRFVWGRGDTTLLPVIVDLVKSGRFRWVGDGRHLTATTHIDNTVEGLVLGATKAPAGSVYFVTDGEPVVWREFLTELIQTQGVEPPDKTAPVAVARALAATSETVWRLLRRPGSPPLTRFSVWVSSQECTIDISRARRDLGYEPVKDRATGLAELRASGA